MYNRVVRTPVESRRVRGAFEYPDLVKKKEKKKTDEKDGTDGKEQEEDQQLSAIGRSLIQAEKILDTARREAEVIKQKAEEEGYESGRQRGYDDGYQDGLEQGLNVYQEKERELEGQVKAYIEDVQVEKDKTLEAYMDDLKEIALTIGEKIVKTSLRSDARVVERMIIAATGKLRKSEWAKIYVGSMEGDGTDVKADPGFLQELSHLSDNVKIIVMEDTEPGTCIVERPDEIIDVSVGTQLESIREIMNNARL